MNQKVRQKGTSPVEWDFYKLLNNANFGINCRNDINNCKLEPIFDEIGEISYIKKLVPYLIMKIIMIFILHNWWEKTLFKNITG